MGPINMGFLKSNRWKGGGEFGGMEEWIGGIIGWVAKEGKD